MLLGKWCPLLMRMMSPLTVGLILFCLISTSSSSSSSHQLQTTLKYTTHPTFRSLLTSKSINHANHSSLAKQSKPNGTETLTQASNTSANTLQSPEPRISNGSNRLLIQTRRVPKLNLSLKLKVRNGSDVNSTVVYLPRLSRSMVNFTKNNSEDKNLLPVIVSSHRRILLNPNEYTIRSESPDSNQQNSSNSSHSVPNLKRRVSRNPSAIRQKTFGLRISESSPKRVRAFPALKVEKLAQTRRSSVQLPSESTALVNIKRNSRNGLSTNPDSSTFQFSPRTLPKISNTNHAQRKHRRQGRNYYVGSLDDHYIETSSKKSVPSSTYYKTTKLPSTKNTPETPKLFITYNNFTSPNRDSSVDSTLNQNEENITSDLGYSYAEKKAKNLTIYEILKPRLKLFSNLSEELEFSPDHNSFSLKNDAVSHQIVDADENDGSVYNSSTTINVPDSREINNNSFVTNGIEYETPNSFHVTGRSDLTYDIQYIKFGRNNSAVISPLNITEVPLDKISENDEEYKQSSTDSSGPHPGTTLYANDIITVENTFGKNEKKADVTSYNLLYNNTISRNNNPEENLSADGSEYRTSLYESDSVRMPKMSENTNAENVPFKNPKIDSKMFYDYFAKKPIGNVTLRDFPYPEYRPGNMFRYSDMYQRKPILDVVYTRSTPIIRLSRTEETMVTEETVVNPTTFNSLRTSVRVMSTFYPNRMQDATMKFGNKIESTTLPSAQSDDKRLEHRNEDDHDDAEFRDSVDPGFTMEKLAYLLIGTCCGLSILCLLVVVVAIKCRRAIVEKRLKAQFRKRMYQHERMKDLATPWQQQMFDHFMYLHRRPGDSSCSSNADSCNCRCVTWSLGARNLDATRPLCPPAGRSSLYLYGQKKLPFGAASTLRFENMLGRKRSYSETNLHKNDSPHTDSSHENDSLDIDSDSREGDAPKQCTCIDYNVWPMHPANVPRGFYTLCPNAGRYNVGNCTQHPPVELRTIARDIPPPVTGSNYLDRSEGVVYWSSNDERLI